MKIKCDYCESLFDDTQAICPHCGAPNPGVVRKSADQPITIDELKKWYSDHGLPPYETTRFFIGEDYKGPRAFGIYYDAKSKNYVVYKNKDNGSRAVRYAGTDEAYAVNELFQRLKQEIIQQKRANLEKQNMSAARQPAVKSSSSDSLLHKILFSTPDNLLLAIIAGFLRYFTLLILGVFALFVVIAIGVTVVEVFADRPAEGYYIYEGSPYYYFVDDDDSYDYGWISYSAKDHAWDTVYLADSAVPSSLEKDKQARRYYVSPDWNPGMQFPDFTDSIFYLDRLNDFHVDEGYYQHGDTTYFHASEINDSGWFFYDDDYDDWTYVSSDEIPSDLLHTTIAEDFYFTPTWDASTQFYDFYDSSAFDTYFSSGYENSGSGWDDSDNDSDSWDWGDSDWDSGDSDWDSDW